MNYMYIFHTNMKLLSWIFIIKLIANSNIFALLQIKHNFGRIGPGFKATPEDSRADFCDLICCGLSPGCLLYTSDAADE